MVNNFMVDLVNMINKKINSFIQRRKSVDKSFKALVKKFARDLEGDKTAVRKATTSGVVGAPLF